MLDDLSPDNDGPLDEFNLPLFSARSVSEISSISDEDHNVYNPSFKQRWNILKMINVTLSRCEVIAGDNDGDTYWHGDDVI